MKQRRVPLGYLNVSEQAKQYVLDALNNNRLSAGPYIAKFEKEFGRQHGVSACVFTSSGTSALQIALAALKEKHGYQDGDEVIVPAVTFVASANVVLQNNMVPVFVDVDPRTYNLDPARIAAHLTPRTRAIMPVHLFGLPCDMDPIMALAQERGLQVIEDSCETMFVRYKGRPVGSFGDFGCFSTYVAHLLITGVGGLVTVKDPSDEKLIRSIMQHGRDTVYLNIDDDDKVSPELFESLVQRRFSFVRMGYSHRTTELEGALGVAALEQKDAMMQKRQEIAAHYKEQLAQFQPLLQLPFVPEGSEHAFMMYPVVLDDSIHRDKFLLHLERNGVETRYMMPLLNQPYYEKTFGKQEHGYPVAARINRQGFYIPCHDGMTLADVEFIAALIKDYLGGRS